MFRNRQAEAIENLSIEVQELTTVIKSGLEWFKSHANLATKHDLLYMERRIMSAISTWVEKVVPKLDSIQTGIDALQELVEELQNSPGAITPEDQALLDQIESKVNALATDAEGLPPAPTA